ncbi:MAG TPA: CAP domain-containing protein [Kofleriaceae bacterium]|jgi:hypothetical protein|nr:CAP domain-containing protein [Kofleriaceae bacterium]
MRGIITIVVLAACQPNTFVKTMPREAPPAPGYALVTAQPSERELLDAINRERGSAGVAPLAWCDQVALVAHDPTQKYDFGTLAYDDIRIDSAIAPDLVAALQYWLGDMVQRANILSPTATHVGIAVKTDELGHVGATVITVRVPPAVDPRELVKRIAAVLVPMHSSASLETKRRQPDNFRFAAQAAADQLATGGSPDDVRAVVLSWAPSGITSVARIPDVAVLAEDDNVGKLLHNPAATAFGAGVAQGTDREHGRGAVWIVIVSD